MELCCNRDSDAAVQVGVFGELKQWNAAYLRDRFGDEMFNVMFGQAVSACLCCSWGFACAQGDGWSIKPSGTTLERPYEQLLRLRSALDAMRKPRGRAITIGQVCNNSVGGFCMRFRPHWMTCMCFRPHWMTSLGCYERRLHRSLQSRCNLQR